jgi:hypothetical protein
MKDSFVLYTSQYVAIKELEDEQLGRLFRALFEKQLGNEVVLTNDIKIAFNFINNQMVVDNQKYKKKCETLKNNAKKGGAPKGNQNAKKQKQPNREKNNLNDNDNDNEIIINDNLKEKNKKEKISFGEFKNVLLSEEELEKLKQRFSDYELRIEKLSNYIASKGDRYKSHYATILNWARNEKKESDVAEIKPKWYGKEVKKKEMSQEEVEELENILSEFKN